ncbi:glycosyl transferase family 28 [Enemella evansiae]|uniref:nucleotide disphospho-sugar-binding domain-containing protein n=1 Tax=Enemella evansiae TaxID=2016499 RepID=UPI000B977942|nr:nucleotide disphospho-sugar-binding domain-containing protein [Enemella evansiae]OYO15493.1 glycosyl transferase family 28 [Enemella evansiae]
MRVICVQWPNPSHLYPTVPLLWALQSQGHQVLVTSHPDLGPAVRALGLDFAALDSPQWPAPKLGLEAYAEFDPPQAERDRYHQPLGLLSADEVGLWDQVSSYIQIGVHILHPPGRPSPTGENLIQLCADWQPDLVLWEPAVISAPIAARLCGAAHARVLWGPDYLGWGYQRLRTHTQDLAQANLTDPFHAALAPLAAAHGIEVTEEILYGQATVDPGHPALRLPCPGPTLPMRRIPYSGVRSLPDWADQTPHRPRLAISLGSSVRTHMVDQGPIGVVLEAVKDLDIDVVATLNEDQLRGQTLPANVQAVDYLPLNVLLPTCAAIIHHGGGGTFGAAVAHGTPQLIMPGSGGLEAHLYARLLQATGAGLRAETQDGVETIATAITTLLEDQRLHTACAHLTEDWKLLTSPHHVATQLASLAPRP